MIDPMLIKKQRILLIVFSLLIVLATAFALNMGEATIEFERLLPIFFGNGSFEEEFILFSLRLPRILVTVLAGMALALSGGILQGLTRNDLADPGIIGINAGAGVAVAIFFLFFPVDAASFSYLLPVVAFLGAMVIAILIYVLSYERSKGVQPTKMILTGVGFSMALSGIMIVLISSQERAKVDFIASWLAGSIWGTDWPYIIGLLPWLIVLIPFTLWKANRLNILNVSEEVAVGVGVSVEKERITLLLTAVALAASAVAVTGGIAFVGLMAPHIAKALVGNRHQLFLPLAILIGGLLLLLADTIGQNILSTGSIPAGIVVSLIGAPYFLYLMMKK